MAVTPRFQQDHSLPFAQRKNWEERGRNGKKREVNKFVYD